MMGAMALYPRRWVRTVVERTPATLLPSPRRWVTYGAGHARPGAQQRMGTWRAKVGFLRHFLP